MRWDIPAAWWGMLAVAALGVWILSLLARRRAALERFAEAGLVDRLVSGLDRRRRAARVWLRLLALGLLVAAAAGPRWGVRWEEVRREGIDLIVALDTSRSMLAPDVAPNRLERAKLAVLDLRQQLEGDRIGLVAFAGTAFLECPLTLDYSAFERSLQAIYAGIIPRGGTALARAIDTALTSFEARQGKYQALVLITDGEDHEGEVEEAAKRAAEAGVKIYAVGIGTSEGELLPAQAAGAQGFFKDREGRVVKSRLDEQTLQKIAEVTGGAYVRGLGPSLGLGEVFRDYIAPMERRDVGSRLERRWEPRFQIPLALVLVVLLIEAGLGDARRASGFASWWKARRGRAVAASMLALALVSPPPRALAATSGVQGYELYEQGKYGDAAARWREALLDEPDSRLLRYNLGVTLYRDGKFEEAAQAFAAVVAAADPDWKARAAYNLGNSLYRQGVGTRESEPQKTIAAWEQSLGAYLSAMAADAADTDPKFGFELVSKQLAELREKLEKQEEQKQEDQQQQRPGQSEPQDQQSEEQQDREQQQQAQSEQQQQQPDQGEQQAQGEQEPSEQQQSEGEQQQAAEQDESQQAGGEPQSEQAQSEEQDGAASDEESRQASAPPEQSGEGQPGDPAGAGEQQGEQALAGGESGEEQSLDRGAARAVLDTARREELGPGDVERRMMGAAVADPREDW